MMWRYQGVGVDVGLAAWMCHGCGGRCSGCLLPEYMRSMKKPCKCQFTGPVVIPKSSCVCLGCFQPVCSPSKGTRRGGVSHHEIESKHEDQLQKGRSQTPKSVASMFICRLDQGLAALAASSGWLVTWQEVKLLSQTCQYMFGRHWGTNDGWNCIMMSHG